MSTPTPRPTMARQIVATMSDEQKDLLLRDLIACYIDDRIRDVVHPSSDRNHRPEWDSLTPVRQRYWDITGRSIPRYPDPDPDPS